MTWFKKDHKHSTTGAHKKSSPKADHVSTRVSDVIGERNIAFFHAGPSKRQVLGSLLGSLDLPDPSAALKAILTREEAGSTLIAPGIALPHARISGITDIRAALGLSATGVLDHKAGSDPIHIFLLFVGPADNMREHLAFLAAVSALLQSHGFAKELLAQSSAEAVLQKIRHIEKSL